ncbi:MAG TPA: hypothetical protein VEH04_13620 [Verrucomicrobiae bacterium]|nr:hypothetical protein [Verrucomicrobiae bacterium]
MGYLDAVLPLKAIVALLLALVYLPATGHCLLEQAGWLPEAEEACCGGGFEQSEPQTPPCDAECCPLEYGHIVLPGSSQPLICASIHPIFVFTLTPAFQEPAPMRRGPEHSPPWSLQTWQFDSRAALQPRAP